ncbi:MAG: hypothetical protein WAQ33_04395 [Gaiellaceae bacterium]
MMVQEHGAVAAAAIEENPQGGPRHNVPLGTLVLRAGLLPLEAIEQSLREAIKTGRRLGQVLAERGLEERDLVRLLAAQNAQPFVDLTAFPIDYEAVRLLPQAVARTYCAIPIARDETGVTVAVPNAEDERQGDRLRDALKYPVRLVTASRTDIKDVIESVSPADPPPVAPPPPETYDVSVRLVNGAIVPVDSMPSLEAAQALAERVASEARVGAMIKMREGTIDGSDVVSVEVFLGEHAS